MCYVPLSVSSFASSTRIVQLPAIHAVQRLPHSQCAGGEAPTKARRSGKRGRDSPGWKSFGTDNVRKGEVPQLHIIRLEETALNIVTRSSIMVLWTGNKLRRYEFVSVFRYLVVIKITFSVHQRISGQMRK